MCVHYCQSAEGVVAGEDPGGAQLRRESVQEHVPCIKFVAHHLRKNAYLKTM